MNSEIDLDIAIHLGHVHNIGVSQKGVYIVQLSLYFGQTNRKIPPVGLFSSPSSLDSFVYDQRIPPARICSICEVDDSNQSFKSRSFVIRYKDEKHELNDGAHWRITIPMEFNEFRHIPFSEETIQVKFELLYCGLLEEFGLNIFTDIDAMIPVEPKFELVATQSFVIQHVTTGVHEYFPVHFSPLYFMNLDCMFHSAVTAIRFKKLSLSVIPAQRSEKSGNQSIGTSSKGALREDVASPGGEYFTDSHQVEMIHDYFEQEHAGGGDKPHLLRSNGERESISENSAVATENHRRPARNVPFSVLVTPEKEDKDHVFSKLLRSINAKGKQLRDRVGSPENMLFPDTAQEGVVESKDIAVALFKESSSKSNFEYSGMSGKSGRSGLDFDELHFFVTTYSTPVIANYQLSVMSSRFILDTYALWKDKDEAIHSSEKPAAESKLNDCCFLAIEKTAILKELMALDSTSEILHSFQHRLEDCNAQLSMRWSLLMLAFRRIMPTLLEKLKPAYASRKSAFWCQQMLVHTKCAFGTQRWNPDEDTLLFDVLGEQLRHEAEKVAVLRDAHARRELPVCDGEGNVFYARGLRIFDADVHMETEKLPRLLLQQYVDPNCDYSSIPLPAGSRIYDKAHSKETAHSLFAERAGRLLANIGNNSAEAMVGSRVKDIVSLVQFPVLNALPLEAVNQQFGWVSSYLQYSPSCQVQRRPESLDVDRVMGNKPAPGEVVTECHPRRNNMKKLILLHNISRKEVPPAKEPNPLQRRHEKTHLVVLQHGFLGTGYDMTLLEQAITVDMSVHTQVFIPRANENHGQESIVQMAKKFAAEVCQYCRDKMPLLLEAASSHRISFIGHSMGGLIIRLALQDPLMQPLLNKLHCYVSLATPHLGTHFADSQLIQTGMWAFFKFKKCASLKELMFEDTSLTGKIKNTLLYKLSENGTLSLFRKVVFVSSPKDQYVPAYSARVQANSKIDSLADHHVGSAINAMIRNILHSLHANQLVRVTIDNNVGEDTMNVNTMIGRTAHICYLENPVVATQLISVLQPFLQ